MSRFSVLAILFALLIVIVGQVSATCVGGAPDGEVEVGEECDPLAFLADGKCSSTCLNFPIDGNIADTLDGWDFVLEDAISTDFGASTTSGQFNCSKWFPDLFKLVATYNQSRANSMICSIVGQIDTITRIEIRVPVADMSEPEFVYGFGTALYLSDLKVTLAALWKPVFPGFSGSITYKILNLANMLFSPSPWELRAGVWFDLHGFGRRPQPLSPRAVSWIPDCVFTQQLYYFDNQVYNVSSDNIPTIDLRASYGSGFPTSPVVTWSLIDIEDGPASPQANWTAAISTVLGVLTDANTNGTSGNVDGNLLLALPWYVLAFPAASGGVSKYPTWHFTAAWLDSPLFSITGGDVAETYSIEFTVTFYAPSLSPNVVVTMPTSTESWGFGPAQTIQPRGVNVCPGLDELNLYNPSQQLNWLWQNQNRSAILNTNLLPDANTMLTTTARASYLPANAENTELNLFVSSNGHTLAVQNRLSVTDSPYRVNIRTGGGTHGSSANWTLTASVQGIEDGKNSSGVIWRSELGGLPPFNETQNFIGQAVLSCYRAKVNDFVDLCDTLVPTRVVNVFTWTIPSSFLFAGNYTFYVSVQRVVDDATVAALVAPYFGWTDAVDITVVDSTPPEVAIETAGLQSGRLTPVDPRVDTRITNPLFNPDYTYAWTISYGNAHDVVTSTNGQVVIIPKNHLRQNKYYEIRVVATNAIGVSAVATGHFFTKRNLNQVFCEPIVGNRTAFNKVHISCRGTPSEYLAGPIRYQVRGYLTANFTVGDDPWLPLSGFSTINNWDIFLPYNILNVVVYAEDQAGAYNLISVSIPPLVNASVRAGGQTLANLRGGVANAQRTNDFEALYNVGTALAAVLNGVLRNDTTDFNRRELIRAIIDPDFVADLDPLAIDSALRFVSFLTTRDDFLPDLPQRLLGDIFTWIKENLSPIVTASDLELSDTLVATVVDVLDRLSSSSLASIRDVQPLQDYQSLIQFVIDNFFQTQNPLPANTRFGFSGPVGNFKILIDTYAPTKTNTPPTAFGARSGANVTFTVPASLWAALDATNPIYPIAVVVTDVGINYYGYFSAIAEGSVLSNLVSLRFFDAKGNEIPINNTVITVSVVTHSNNTGVNILPAFANLTLGDWDSNGLVPRGTRVGPIIKGRQEFVFTTSHLTTFTIFQGDFVVTPPVGELATLANSDPAYYVTAILIILAAIGGGLLLVTLIWLGVRLADQRTYHPVTNRSSLIRIRERKDVPTEEDYMSPSQSDSSMVSVHLRRPYYDNGLVIYEDEDSVRSHRSDDEGIDEDEPRSGSPRSRSSVSRSRSPSRSRSHSRSPSPSDRSSTRASAKSSPRD